MPTYTLSYVQGTGLTFNGNEIVSINDLLKGLNLGYYEFKNLTDRDKQVKGSQQVINYLDCIKDGTNVSTLQQLNIFPDAGRPAYNTFLHQLEDDIISEHSQQINTNYWHKTKPDKSKAELNNPKIYDEVLWESGLGPKWFVKTASDKTPTYIKTFGSFIDPLEKNSADKTWPSTGNTVKIDKLAMNAMGFPNCSLEARTDSNDIFTFKMEIGTGNGCSPCVIDENTPDYKKYFAGNKTKNTALKTNGPGPSTAEKVKMIMIKEWGDKMQCLIYLLKYHYEKSSSGNSKKTVMSSCDKVVYILCLLLKLPFIYSGYDESVEAINKKNKKNNDDVDGKNYKHYSISEFRPIDDPVEYLKEHCTNIKNSIVSNNDDFKKFLDTIDRNTKLKLANTFDIQFKEDGNGSIPFIIGCKADIQAYTDDAKTRLDSYLNVMNKMVSMSKSSPPPPQTLADQQADLETIEKSIASVKEQDTVVPFIKVKKGTEAHLCCIQTCSYTLKPKNHPNPNLFYKPNLRDVFKNDYGNNLTDDETFARIPFFQLIRGRNKNGFDLKLGSQVIQSGGMSKHIVIGGNDTEDEDMTDHHPLDDDIRDVLFDGDNIDTLKSAAMNIGYIPDYNDQTTWDKYIVTHKEEHPSPGNYLVKEFTERNLFSKIDLEANLINGIIYFCKTELNNNMNYFDTLYNVCIYQGIITAELGEIKIVDKWGGPISLPLFPEYYAPEPSYFIAALKTFLTDDGIIGRPSIETLPITNTFNHSIQQSQNNKKSKKQRKHKQGINTRKKHDMRKSNYLNNLTRKKAAEHKKNRPYAAQGLMPMLPMHQPPSVPVHGGKKMRKYKRKKQKTYNKLKKHIKKNKKTRKIRKTRKTKKYRNRKSK
jgi:hypothetical protein